MAEWLMADGLMADGRWTFHLPYAISHSAISHDCVRLLSYHSVPNGSGTQKQDCDGRRRQQGARASPWRARWRRRARTCRLRRAMPKRSTARPTRSSARPAASALAVPADLSKADAIAHWHAATMEQFGGVDLLFANTGGPPAGTALSFDDAGLAVGVRAAAHERRPDRAHWSSRRCARGAAARF